MTRGHRIRRLSALLARAVVSTAIGLGAPGLALADDDIRYGGHDWYGSVYGMLGIPNADADNVDPSGGAILSAGFRVNRWVAAEVGGEWAYKFSYDEGSGPVTCSKNGSQSDYFNAWQVSAGGRFYATESMFQPFLLAHGGFINTRDRGGGRSCQGTGFMTRLGGGLEMFVSNGVAVSLLGAYVLPLTGGAKDHDYVSIGLGITWY
jgi:hypothetical protein